MRLKLTLIALSLVLPVLAGEVKKSVAPPRIVDLGEIQILGDIERPNVGFVIPRASFDFLYKRGGLEKEILVQDVINSVKDDMFKVE